MNKFVPLFFVIILYYLIPLTAADITDEWVACTNADFGSHKTIDSTTYYCCKDGSSYKWQTTECDTTPPSCSISSITEFSLYAYVSGTTVYYSTAGSGSFIVTVSASDSSGISKVNFPTTVSLGGDDTTLPYSWTYNWDSGDTFEGPATVTCYDNAGNTNTASFTVDRDVTPPSGGSINYDKYYSNKNVLITLDTGTDSESGIDASSDFIERRSATLSGDSCSPFSGWSTIITDPDTSVTDGGVDNGCYQYRYTISDNVGNKEIYTGDITKVDTTPPKVGQASIYSGTTYSNGKDYWYNGIVSMRAIASDSETRVESCEYTTDGVNWFHADYDGTCYIKNIAPNKDITINFRATNPAGGTGTGTSRSYTYDNSRPTTTASATLPDGSAYTFGKATRNNVKVTLSCSDNDRGSGCKETKYCTDTTNTCTPNTIYSKPIIISSDGTTYVRFYSVDNLGNEEPIQTRTVIIDKSPPTRSNGQPTGTITTTTTTLSLTTNEPATCKYSTSPRTSYYSMTNTFSTTGGTSHSTQLSGLSPGSHHYYVRCQDALGNANNDDYKISFTVCARYNPVVSVTPSSQTGEPGNTRTYTVNVFNNDQSCGTETFSLTTIGCPTGWTCQFAQSDLSIPSGSSASTTLSITSSNSAQTGSNQITIKATNAADNSKFATTDVTYNVICVYRVSMEPMPNFDLTTKQGRFDGIEYTWVVSLSDSGSSSSCGTNIPYTIKSITTSGSCNPESGIYLSTSVPPAGGKITLPFSSSVPRNGESNNAYKVFVKRDGPNSCTLSFNMDLGGGKSVDPSFTLEPDTSDLQPPHVSFFDFSGDSEVFNVRWEAFYPNEPFREMKVKCSLYNPTDDSCDPDSADCSEVAGKGCLPYDALQGTDELKKGSCAVSSPKYDFNNDNSIICIFYDPDNPTLKTRINHDFTPVDFTFTTADKITTTVGHPVELKIDVANKGVIADSYVIELSGTGTVEIVPTSISTPEIKPGQITSTSFSITPLVDQNEIVTLTVTSLLSGKTVTKELELNPGILALPEFGLLGFLQIIIISAILYFLYIIFKSKGKSKKK